VWRATQSARFFSDAHRPRGCCEIGVAHLLSQEIRRNKLAEERPIRGDHAGPPESCGQAAEQIVLELVNRGEYFPTPSAVTVTVEETAPAAPLQGCPERSWIETVKIFHHLYGNLLQAFLRPGAHPMMVGQRLEAIIRADHHGHDPPGEDAPRVASRPAVANGSCSHDPRRPHSGKLLARTCRARDRPTLMSVKDIGR
jgi:hypothetical protein